MPHIIRLRGPWHYTDGKKESLVAGIIQVPCALPELLGSDFEGYVCFSRRFNRPTNLEELAATQLALADTLDSSIRLNGEILSDANTEAGYQVFTITDRLQLQNVLQVVLKIQPPAAGLFGGAELRLIGRSE